MDYATLQIALLVLNVLAHVVLEILDIKSTLGFLERGGKETNQTIAGWMSRHGQWGWVIRKLGIAAASLAVVIWVFIDNGPNSNGNWIMIAALLGVNIYYGWVVSKNLKVGR